MNNVLKQPSKLIPLQNEIISKGQMGYIFELEGYNEKVTLFSIHFLQASQYISYHPFFSTLRILNIQTFRPIVGLTEKNVMNGSFIWVGVKASSPDGWLQKNIYLNSYT